MKKIKNQNGVEFDRDLIDYIMSDNPPYLSRNAYRYVDTEYFEDISKFDIEKMRDWNNWTQDDMDLWWNTLTMICEDPEFHNR